MQALNIAIRMLPRKKYPANSRSFFTPEGRESLGSGIEVWRGYFQSLRPSIGRLLLNVDISAAAMYRSGPLIDLCMEFLGLSSIVQLLPRNLSEAQKRSLSNFLQPVLITT
jgi:eukaryotic translation initiation factor 2C